MMDGAFLQRAYSAPHSLSHKPRHNAATAALNHISPLTDGTDTYFFELAF
jgi:hypothetical protein